jgi:hypothetical protein
VNRWLSLREATRHAKIGKARLKDLAVRGVVKGCPDPDNKRGDWIFDRLSLDAYREGQMSGETPREKALAILKGSRI